MMEEGHHWVSPVFRAVIVEGLPVNREPAKHGDVRWWPVDGFPANLAQGARDGLRVRRAAER